MTSTLVLLALVACANVLHASLVPEQIHLSYGDSEASIIVVMWSTLDKVEESIVRFAVCKKDACTAADLLNETKGELLEFVDGGTAKHVSYIHRVKLGSLEPQQKYAYQCGGNGNWSEVLTFKTAGDHTWVPKIAVFGDLGYENSVITNALSAEAQKGNYDAAIGAGDYAYDFAKDNGTLGDRFMNLIQPFASRLPMALAVGNHEDAYNFSHFINRFTMPNHAESQNMYYSLNLGQIHLVFFSTELYFYPQYYTTDDIRKQYQWIEQDLKQAVANRATRPWLVTVAHKPMYCSDSNVAGGNLTDDCTIRAAYIRNGNISVPYGLEQLFHQYNVDLAIWGHVHNYERTWPVYNNQVFKSDKLDYFKDASALVHVISGAGGSLYGLRDFAYDQDFTAVQFKKYCFGQLIGWNNTHLSLEHFEVLDINKTDTKSIDKFWLVKNLPNSASSQLKEHWLLFYVVAVLLLFVR